MWSVTDECEPLFSSSKVLCLSYKTTFSSHYTNSCFELTFVIRHQKQAVSTPALYLEKYQFKSQPRN